jgi:hypothetical protein
MHPCLAEYLKPGGWVEDELYLYRRSKTNKVYRMAKMEYTKESFMLHGLTDSATHKNPYPKNYHYEILRKRGKKLGDFGNNEKTEVIV